MVPFSAKGLRYVLAIIVLFIVGGVLLRSKVDFPVRDLGHLLAAPLFEMVCPCLNYAWSRTAARFRTELGLMFALK